MNSGKRNVRDAIVDLLCVGLFAGVIVAGGWLLVSNPEWWGWCITVLDVRNVPKWPQRTWTCVIGAVLAILLAMRFWPERNQKDQRRVPPC